MRKIIDKVTITGADNSVHPEDLLKLSDKYPFVEWGILLSKASQGNNRFPDLDWLQECYKTWFIAGNSMTNFMLSGHICGTWVRHICEGQWTMFHDLPDVTDMFGRFQLNFHSYVHKLNQEKFLAGFDDPELYYRQFIFQLDDVNNSILEVAKNSEIDAVGLFDLSGGLGVLPKDWPVSSGYCGYAGGLSPENLQSQMELIDKVVGEGPIWIDVETHVRSNGDAQFDLDRVQKFLDVASDWVIEPIGKECHEYA